MEVSKPARTSEIQQELLKLERQWWEAIVKRDQAFSERIAADEYIFTDPTGAVHDKQGDIEQSKSGTIIIESAELDDMKVRVYGETSVVTARNTIIGNAMGQDISGQYRFTDVFVRRDGRWQCVASQMTRILQQ